MPKKTDKYHVVGLSEVMKTEDKALIKHLAECSKLIVKEFGGSLGQQDAKNLAANFASDHLKRCVVVDNFGNVIPTR